MSVERVKTVLSTLWSPEAQGEAETHCAAWLLGGAHWSAQHPARAWEYGLAVEALDEVDTARTSGLVLDVGGAGSPLAWIVAQRRCLPVQIIDPEFNGIRLGERSQGWAALKGHADFVACISVLEHVECEEEFLFELAYLLAPGGVLFLTVDYDPTSTTAGDNFMYHWMRKRIYNETSFYLGDDSVTQRLMRLGLKPFGDMRVPLQADSPATDPPVIPGLGYTFASLCMQKELT